MRGVWYKELKDPGKFPGKSGSSNGLASEVNGKLMELLNQKIPKIMNIFSCW